MPIGDEVARLPQEWFLNTPVLWLGALVLISTIRGPLRNAPVFIKKLLSLAVASLIALGLLASLVWEPVHQGQQGISSLYRGVDSASRTDPYRFDRFVSEDSVVQAQSKEGSRDRQQPRSATGTPTGRGDS